MQLGQYYGTIYHQIVHPFAVRDEQQAGASCPAMDTLLLGGRERCISKVSDRGELGWNSVK